MMISTVVIQLFHIQYKTLIAKACVSGPDYFSSTAASPSFLLQPTADFCHPCTSHFHTLPYMDISMLFLSFQPIPGLHTIYPAYSSPLTIKTLTIFPSPAFLLFCAHQCISFSCITLFLVTSYLPTYLPTYHLNIVLIACLYLSLVVY